MLGVIVEVWGIMQSVPKKKKRGCSGKDLIVNERVPIQLAQCWFLGWPFPVLKY